MLKIIRSFRDLDFGSLMDVYAESNQFRVADGEDYFFLRQELYDYLKNVFFQNGNGFYAVWSSQHRYTSVLRMEQYEDGYLITALETALEERNKGYAKNLILATLSSAVELQNVPVYAHVHKGNAASFSVHEDCGFKMVADYAVFLDKSVYQDHYTLKWMN